MAAELASRPTRLADLPAPAVLGLLEMVPIAPEALAVLQIRPGPSEGLVVLEVAAPAVMGRLVLEGDAARPIALPRSALLLVKRRHGNAERLVVDSLELDGPGQIGLRSFGPDCTVAITCPEAAALPALPMVDLPLPPARPVEGDALPLLLDPALLARALAVLARLGINRVRIHPLSDPLVGLALEPGTRSSELTGSLQLARCVLLEAR